jgi:hypothetical protein
MADRDVPFAASAQDFPDLEALPGYLFDDPQNASSPRRRSSCAYCGVGDAAALTVSTSTRASATPLDATERAGTLRVAWHGSMVQYRARRLADGTLEVDCDRPLTAPGSLLPAILDLDERSEPIVARARRWVPGGPARGRQSFELSDAGLVTSKARLHSIQPTRGCMKLKTSLGSRPTVFPIQLIPSIKSPDGGPRLAVSYE